MVFYLHYWLGPFTLITKVMQNIGNELKAIAAELDLLYVRAIDVNDLNQELQNIKVDKPILVYAGLAPIDFDNDLTTYEVAKIEATIYILDLHKSADPTAEQIDGLLAPLYILVNQVYDLLSRSDLIAPAYDLIRDSLQSSETVELTDENLGGWEMVLTVPIARDLYDCGKKLPAPRLIDADVYNVGPDRFVLHFDQNVLYDNADGWRLFINNTQHPVIGYSLPDNNILILDIGVEVENGDVCKLDYINGNVTNIEGLPLDNLFDYPVENHVQSANSPEADDVLNSMPNPLTADEIESIVGFVNAFSNSLGNNEWNSHFDSFPHFGLQDPINALWDWKRELSMTNNGAVHVPGVGYDFNGAEFIDTNYIPSINGVNLNENSSGIGAFIVQNNDKGVQDVAAFGAAGNTTVQMYQRPSFNRLDGSMFGFTGRLSAGVNEGYNDNSLYIVAAEDIIFCYENGIDLTGGQAGSFTELTNISIYIGGRNSAGSFTAAIKAMMSSFIALANEGFDHLHYYDELTILNESLGGVITQNLQAV